VFSSLSFRRSGSTLQQLIQRSGHFCEANEQQRRGRISGTLSACLEKELPRKFVHTLGPCEEAWSIARQQRKGPGPSNDEPLDTFIALGPMALGDLEAVE
jgi:hypothetical protein